MHQLFWVTFFQTIFQFGSPPGYTEINNIAIEILTTTGACINFLVFGGGAAIASSQIQGSDPMVAHAAPTPTPPTSKKLIHAIVFVKISIAILLIPL